MAFDQSLRIGAGTLERDVYGGDFTSGVVDLGKTSEEKGIVINYSNEVKKVRSAQDITVDELFLLSEEMMIECDLKEHLLENIAQSFGHQVSDVVDDTVSTPNNKSLQFGGARALPVYAWRFKIKQIADPTLFDIITINRGLIVPAFNQTFTVRNERYIPVKIECLGDPANSGKIGTFLSEYS